MRLLMLLLTVCLVASASGCGQGSSVGLRSWPYASTEPTASRPPVPRPQGPVATPEPEGSTEPDGEAEPAEPSKPAQPDEPVQSSDKPSGSASLSNKTLGWYYLPNSQHEVPGVAPDARSMLGRYNARFVGPDRSDVYLTFDQGYENGNTRNILDALARNGVKATFFVTGSYITGNPDLVKAMVREGHVVANHSWSHPSMPGLTRDREVFSEELSRTEAAFREVTGERMAKVFRPPMGEYSERSLWLSDELGYQTVFWSFAHRDWIVDDQPPVAVTLKRILDGSHPGAIYLLHGVSSSDTEALDDAITGLRKQGYGFGTL